MNKWFIIKCHGGKEEIAAAQMHGLGLETYLPYCQIEGRKQWEKMFPTYLFIGGTDILWSHVRFRHGVLYPLPRYPKDAPPKSIEPDEINRLRALEMDGRVPLKDSGLIRPGDRVEALEGWFAGHRGTVKRVRLDDIVKVTLDNGVKAEIHLQGLKVVVERRYGR